MMGLPKGQTIREGGAESHGSVGGKVPGLSSHGIKTVSRVAEGNGSPALLFPRKEVLRREAEGSDTGYPGCSKEKKLHVQKGRRT